MRKILESRISIIENQPNTAYTKQEVLDILKRMIFPIEQKEAIESVQPKGEFTSLTIDQIRTEVVDRVVQDISYIIDMRGSEFELELNYRNVVKITSMHLKVNEDFLASLINRILTRQS
jgi:hypothetical protein